MRLSNEILIFIQRFLQIKEARISSVLSEPQRALLGFITSGQETIFRAESDLMSKVSDPVFEYLCVL